MDPKEFEGMQEVKPEYNTLAWGKVGDWFKGTLTDNTRGIKSAFPPFDMQTVYEFKAHGGSFHDIIKKVVQENATECVKGDFWSLISGKPAIVNALKRAKLGQIVAFRFTEEKAAKTPGYNDAKIVSVYLGEMDPEYQGEQKGD